MRFIKFTLSESSLSQATSPNRLSLIRGESDTTSPGAGLRHPSADGGVSLWLPFGKRFSVYSFIALQLVLQRLPDCEILTSISATGASVAGLWLLWVLLSRWLGLDEMKQDMYSQFSLVASRILDDWIVSLDLQLAVQGTVTLS